MITILEMPAFIEDADRLFTLQERDDLKTILAVNPEVGDLIPATGGVRKLRVPLETRGKGKSGGARVIYYYYNSNYPLAIIAVYAKGEKIDVTMAEKRELRILTREYVVAFGKKVVSGRVSIK